MVDTPSPTLENFIAHCAWGQALSTRELGVVLRDATELRFARKEHIAKAGTVAEAWIGIIDGFGVHSVTDSEGTTSFLAAGSSGAWFGEGTLMKSERWGYDAVALRDTRVASVPKQIFDWLRATSLPFNHALQEIMNRRLAVFIGNAAVARHASLEGRVAHVLVNLLASAQAAPSAAVVKVSQCELAMLAGISRQHANKALKNLQDRGLLALGKGEIEVTDPGSLSRATQMRRAQALPA